MSYTVTKVWQAKWYKRPFLWLLGKPTRMVDIYHDVNITSIEFSIEGETMSSTFKFEGKK